MKSFLVSSNIDTTQGLEALDVNLPITAESRRSACLQYTIECGFGDGGFAGIVDIGTEDNPCTRYCIVGSKSKLFVYVSPRKPTYQ